MQFSKRSKQDEAIIQDLFDLPSAEGLLAKAIRKSINTFLVSIPNSVLL